jgi:hypothetical protein
VTVIIECSFGNTPTVGHGLVVSTGRLAACVSNEVLFFMSLFQRKVFVVCEIIHNLGRFSNGAQDFLDVLDLCL